MARVVRFNSHPTSNEVAATTAAAAAAAGSSLYEHSTACHAANDGAILADPAEYSIQQEVTTESPEWTKAQTGASRQVGQEYMNIRHMDPASLAHALSCGFVQHGIDTVARIYDVLMRLHGTIHLDQSDPVQMYAYLRKLYTCPELPQELAHPLAQVAAAFFVSQTQLWDEPLSKRIFAVLFPGLRWSRFLDVVLTFLDIIQWNVRLTPDEYNEAVAELLAIQDMESLSPPVLADIAVSLPAPTVSVIPLEPSVVTVAVSPVPSATAPVAQPNHAPTKDIPEELMPDIAAYVGSPLDAQVYAQAPQTEW